MYGNVPASSHHDTRRATGSQPVQEHTPHGRVRPPRRVDIDPAVGSPVRTSRLLRRVRAEWLLVGTAVIWGSAFVAQRIGMRHVGPFTFNAVRFGLGALVVHLVAGGVDRFPLGRRARMGTVLTGVLLFLGASFQQAGLVSTGAGKAGFITGVYVVLVPLLALPLGTPPASRTWLGAVLAVGGLSLLRVREGMRIEPGDGLVLVGAVWWAGHVHAVARFAPLVGPLRLARA